MDKNFVSTKPNLPWDENKSNESKVVDSGQRVRMMFHNLKDYSFVLTTYKIGKLTNEKE